MKSVSRVLIAGLCTGSLLMACSSSGGGNTTADTGVPTGDTGTPGDVPRTDVPGTDVPRTDVPATDRPATGNPCTNPTDLTGMTPGPDGSIHVTSNNNSAPESGGLTPPDDCFGAKGGSMGFQVVYRYTMRQTAILRVSTDNAGTDRALDTMIMVASTCSASGTSLACRDDTAQGNLRSTAQTATPVMAGTTVFIAVGAFTPPAGDGILDQGAFELTVREVANVAIGGACTAQDICVDGAACMANPGSTTMGTCIADGARRGRCRLTGGACDTGLTCSVATPTASARGQCLQSVPVGGDCSAAGTACATGSSCQPPTGSVRTCVADGLRGGNCRTASPRCDTGLECSSGTPGTCRASVASGGACDPAGVSTFCATGTFCVPSSETAGVCGAATAETEPNNSPMAVASATPVSGGALFSGGLTPATDVDCYRINVPAGAGLRLEISDGSGGCPTGADTLLRLYGPGATGADAGTPLVEDDDDGAGLCSLITPATDAAARDLPAGVYTVCASLYDETAVPSYYLSATVITPGAPTDGGTPTDATTPTDTGVAADTGVATDSAVAPTDVGGGG